MGFVCIFFPERIVDDMRLQFMRFVRKNMWIIKEPVICAQFTLLLVLYVSLYLLFEFEFLLEMYVCRELDYFL